MLKVADKTLRRWEESGLLIPLRSEGGHRRYKRRELEKFQQKRTLGRLNKQSFHLSAKKTTNQKSVDTSIKKSINSVKDTAKHEYNPILVSLKPADLHPQVPGLLEEVGKVQPATDAVLELFAKNRSTSALPISQPQAAFWDTLGDDQRQILAWTKRAVMVAVLLLVVSRGWSFAQQASQVASLLPTPIRQLLANSTSSKKTDLATKGVILGDTTYLDNVILKVFVPSEFYASVSAKNTLSVGQDLDVGGNTILTGDLAVNGGDITSTATILNIGSGVNQINLGGTTGTVTALNDFTVEGLLTAGQNVQVNGVPYSFPSVQGGGSTFLSNNGSGTLTWTTTPQVTNFSQLTGLVTFAQGGTNNSAGFSAGSVIFSDGSKLTSNTSNFFWDNSNIRLGIGNGAPVSAFSVGSSSQFQVTSTGGIAAATGIISSGTIQFTGLNASGAVFTDTTGTLAVTGPGTPGLCLVWTAGNTMEWGSCSAPWQKINSVISPLIDSDDLALGGSSTASAKFQVFGSTGNATTSGSLTFSSTGGINALNGNGFTVKTSPGGDAGLLNRLFISGDGRVGIGTITPEANLHLVGSYGANAALIINQSNSGDILAASSSGVTRLRITNSGGIEANSDINTATNMTATGNITAQTNLTVGQVVTFSALTTNKGVLYTDGSGIVGQTTQGAAGTVLHGNGSSAPTWAQVNLTSEVTGLLPIANGGTNGNATPTAGAIAYGTGTAYAFNSLGSLGDCLISGGTGSPTWTSCALVSGTHWAEAAGAVYVKNTTLDLLVGGTTTASAKFAFINVTAGTPTASISGSVGSTYLTAAGVLQTTNNKTLTLGGDTTGNMVFYPLNGAGYVGINTLTPTAALDVVGTATISGNTTLGNNLRVIGNSVLSNGATINSGVSITGGLTATGGQSFSGGLNNNGGGITNAGAITGATGLTSSGTITFSGLSTGIVHTNSGGVLSSSAINLASADVSGILATTNGGTGLNAYTTGDIIYASGTNVLTTLGIGGAGQVLTVATASGLPVWASVTGPGGICTDCIINDPGSTQAIIPTAPTATGLQIRQASSGSVDIFNVTNFGATIKYLQVDSSGNVITGSPLTVSPAGTHPIAISPVATASSVFTGTITSRFLDATRTWTFPNLSGEVCLTAGNCAGTAAGLSGSGTTNYVTRFASTFVVTDSQLYDDGTFVGINTATPQFKLDVNGNFRSLGAAKLANNLAVDGSATVSGSLIVQGTTNLQSTLGVTGNTTVGGTLGVTGATTMNSTLLVTGDVTFDTDAFFVNTLTHRVGINTLTPANTFSVGSGSEFQISSAGAIAASAGYIGTGNFSITGTGTFGTGTGAISLNGDTTIISGKTLTISSLNTAGGIIYANVSGTLGVSAQGITGDCLVSAGSGTPTWGSCSAAANNQWTVANGVIYATNTNLDFLIGGSSTASAKFALINVIGSNSPTATIAGSVSGAALSMTGDGTISTSNNRSLILNPVGGRVGIGTSTPGSLLQLLSGTSYVSAGSVTTGFGGVGFASTLTTANYSLSGDGSNQTLLNTPTGGSIQLRINNVAKMTLDSNGDVGIGTDIPGSTLVVNGTVQFPTFTTVNGIFYATSAGQLTQLAQGSANTVLHGNGASAPTWSAIDLASADVTGVLPIAQGGTNTNATPTAGAMAYGTGTAYAFMGANATTGLCLTSGGAGAPSWSNCAAASGQWLITSGAIYPANTTLDLLVGGTSTASAKFAFINVVGSGSPTATIAGSVSGAALSLTGDGTIATSNNRSLILNPVGGNVGIGTTAPGRNLEVEGSLANILLDNTAGGRTAIDAFVSGVEISAGAMNTSSKYGGAVKFMSTDPQFSTSNPKWLAGIVSRATEDYVADTDSGMALDFLTTADNAGVSSLPSVKMTIDQAGNVGIGTTTPGALLDVSGTASISSTLTMGGAIRPSTGNLTLQYKSNLNSWASGLTINTLGYVGIGTTTPNARLEVSAGVSGVTSHYASVATLSNDANNRLAFETPNTSIAGLVFGDPEDNDIGRILYDHSDNTLRFTAGATETMTLLGGNVGIRTTTPSTTLDVTGTASISSTLTMGGAIRPSTGNLTLQYKSGLNAWADALTINTLGNVGIGTTTPAFPLDVNGTIQAGTSATAGVVLLRGNYTSGSLNSFGSLQSSGASFVGYAVKPDTGTANGYLSSTAIAIGRSSIEANNAFIRFLTGASQTSTDGGAVTMTEKVRIDSSGLVGIGTTTPGALLDVSGTASVSSTLTMGGAIRPSTGNLTLQYKSGLNAWSDALTINTIGNIGIGTTSPATKLQVAQTAAASTAEEIARFTVSDDTGAFLSIRNTVATDALFVPQIYGGGSTTNVALNITATVGSDSGVNPAMILNTASLLTTRPIFDVRNATTTRLLISAAGLVGLSNSSPLATLDVRPASGTLAIASFSGNTTFATLIADNNSVGDLFTASKSGSTKFVITNAGNVGIGTSIPTTNLNVLGVQGTIVGAIRQDGLVGIVDTTGFAQDVGAALTLGGIYNSAGGYANFGAIKVGKTNATSSQANGYLSFLTSASTGILSEKMRILDTGNVGIGTTAPDARLEINHATGDNLRLTYNDADGSAADYTDFSLDSSGNLTIAPTTDSGVTPGAVNITGTLDVSGHAAFGASAAISTLDTVNIIESYTGAGSISTVSSLQLGQTRTETLSADTVAYGISNTLTYAITENGFEGYGIAALNGVTAGGALTFNYLMGSLNSASSTSTAVSGQDNLIGSRNEAYLASTGTVVSAYGAWGRAYNNNASGTITNAIGVYGQAFTNSTGPITTAYAVKTLVGEATGAITTGYGLYSECNDAATCYGLFVDAGDAEVTTDWGVYVTGEDKNYFSGLVGIGTTTPSTTLDVSGTASVSSTLTMGGAIRPSTGNLTLQYKSGLNAWTDALTINTLGNVGIGTTTAGQRLDVRVADSVTNGEHIVAAFANVGGSAGLVQGWYANGSSNTSGYMRSVNNLPLVLGTSGAAQALTILNTGLVGIGTTTPSTTLDVTGTASVSSTLTMGGAIRPSTGNLTLQYKSGLNAWTDALTINTIGNVGIGATSPTELLTVAGGNLLIDANNVANSQLLLKSSTDYGASRNNYQIGLTGALAGRLLNRNPDFLDGTTGYLAYDNASSGKTTIAATADASAPNSSGQILRVSYDGTGTPGTAPTPGYGGFRIGFPKCSGTNDLVNDYCYRQGNRLIHRIWAKIPSGRTLVYTTNAFGTGGTFQWLTSQAGTGDWMEYIMVQTVGIGGSLLSTGYWYIATDASNIAFDWDVGEVQITAVDEAPTVNRAADLNIGYKTGVNLNFGQLLTTKDAYLAVDSGNVGIGNTTPGAKLDVTGTASVSSTLTMGGAIRPSTGNLTLQYKSGLNAWTDALTINTVGNIGIGTTAPTAKLDVAGTVRLSGAQDTFIDNDTSPYIFRTGGGAGDFSAEAGHLVLQARTSTGVPRDIIFGGGDNTASELMRIKGTGNVGIGNTTPGAKLDVTGTASVSSTLTMGGAIRPSTGNLTLQYKSGLNAWTDALTINTLGNVGIGTTNPTTKLNVVGISGTNTIDGVDYDNTARFGNATNNGLQISTDATSMHTFLSTTFNGSRLGFVTRTGSANFERMSILATGNVGIGTTTPATTLDVSGTASVSSTLTMGGAIRPSTGNLTLQYKSGLNAWTDALTIDTVGNVGIGTTSPRNRLQVTAAASSTSVPAAGTIDNTTALYLTNNNAAYGLLSGIFSTGKAWLQAQRTDATATTYDLLLNPNGGNIGIGTTAPAYKLEVGSGGSVGISNPTAAPTNSQSLPGTLDFNGFGWNTSSGSVAIQGKIALAGAYSSVTGSVEPYLAFSLKGTGGLGGAGSSSLAEYMRITNAGNVGIGTTTPLATLDTRAVSGTQAVASFSGNTTFAALVVDNVGTGDLFTASKSGATKFVIKNSGNVGIGTAQPSAVLDVQNSLITTTNGMNGTFNGLTTGTGLSINSTSTALTTGGIASFDWSPGFAATASGDLVSLNIGQYGTIGNIFNVKNNGTSVFSVSQNQIVAALPTQFTAAGDVGIAYDLQFTNPTSSFIKSTAPLVIQSGETFNSSDLTLRTFNSGNVVLDAAGGVTLNQAQSWTLASSSAALNINSNMLVFNSMNNRLGVNTAVPLATFDLRGSTSTTLPIASISGNTTFAALVVDNVGTGDIFTASKSGATKFVVKNSGNVGIGTTTPAARLQVVSGAILLDNNQFYQGKDTGGTARNLLGLNSGDNLSLGGTSTGDVIFNVGTLGEAVRIKATSGNVGIGTTTPGALLDVSGTASVSSTLTMGGAIRPSTGNLTLQYKSGLNAWTDALTINTVGNVGIGTTTPLFPLSVAADNGTADNQLAFFDGGGTDQDETEILIGATTASFNSTVVGFHYDGANADYGYLELAGGTRALNWTGAGNVGIGTTTPAFKLDVSTTQASTVSAMITNSDTGTNADGLAIKLGFTGAGTATNYFTTFLNGGGAIMGKIQSNAASGISYTSNGIDMAEYFVKDDPNAVIPVGTLVCQGTNGVRACQPGDNGNIVGITSEHPAFLGGVEGPNKVIVALTGQVPLKVTNENGVILSGDTITFSSRIGVGGRQTKAGATVGKALQSYYSDDPAAVGEIMVYVSPSYFDPDAYLAQRDADMYALAQNPANALSFLLKTPTGQIVDKVVTASQAVIANLRAGSITADTITTNTLDAQQVTVAGLTLDDYIAQVVNQMQAQASASAVLANGPLGVANTSSGSTILGSATGSGTLSASASAQLAAALSSTETAAAIEQSFADIELSVEDSKIVVAANQIDQYLDVKGSAFVGGDVGIGRNLVFGRGLVLNDQGLNFTVAVAPADRHVSFLSGLVNFDETGKVITVAGDLLVKGRITTEDPDVAGYARVKAGDSEVKISFSRPYAEVPVITATADDSDVRFTIVEKSVNSFTIRLKAPALQDANFTWTAVSLLGAKTFESVSAVSAVGATLSAQVASGSGQVAGWSSGL